MPVQCISLKRTAVLDPGVNCASTSAMWERGSHRGCGAGSLNRMMSTRPAAARRPYSTFTRFVSALRRLLQAEAESVRRHSRSCSLIMGVCCSRASVRRWPNAWTQSPDVVAAVRDARKLALDLLEIPLGIVRQGVACAGRERPQAHPQFVPTAPDGLQRRTRWEAELALDPVHLDGGGEAVAVLVDALGDPDTVTGRRSGSRHR